MKCKDCAYWKNRTETDFAGIKMFGGCCNNDKFVYAENYDFEQRPDDDMLEYGDYEGYSAYFITGPNFGCIHFKGW